jgi:hypothetical protein
VLSPISAVWWRWERVATTESCKNTSNVGILISANLIPTEVTCESHRLNIRIDLHFPITHSPLMPASDTKLWSTYSSLLKLKNN